MPRKPSTPATRPRLLRIDEAAEELQLSRTTVYRLINSGRLPSIHVGNAGFARISPDDLDAYMRAHRIGEVEEVDEAESA
jgi:excisionase family DNA binding protein